MKMIRTIATLTGLLATTALPAAAETIRLGDSFPVGHYIADNLAKSWMDAVTTASNGEITFEYFPAEQMGKAKDLLQLTQDGVLDVGYVGASYAADKLPLSSVGELPEAFTTSCAGTHALWEIAKPGGALDQAELAPNGVRLLMVMVLPPYQVFTKSQPITGLDSLNGLKLRSTGGTKEIATRQVGAVPVSIAAPEIREALARGTLDGALLPYSSAIPYDLHPILRHATQNANFGSFVATYMISQQRWDRLSPEHQAIFAKAGEEATMRACQIADELNSQDKQVIADAGVEFVDLPADDLARLSDIMATIGDQWADELEGRGRPAKAILAAFRAALEG